MGDQSKVAALSFPAKFVSAGKKNKIGGPLDQDFTKSEMKFRTAHDEPKRKIFAGGYSLGVKSKQEGT